LCPRRPECGEQQPRRGDEDDAHTDLLTQVSKGNARVRGRRGTLPFGSIKGAPVLKSMALMRNESDWSVTEGSRLGNEDHAEPDVLQ